MTDSVHVTAAGGRAFAAARRIGIQWVRGVHRWEVTTPPQPLDEQVLFVANHGFGGITDLNVLATYAAFDELGLTRPVTALVHEIAWSIGAGPALEQIGARRASHESAARAFAESHHVLVLPGGDVEASKWYGDRNKIVFGARRGFAQLAIDIGVPIVPIVTSGAGQTLFVLNDGQWLARALTLDRRLRTKTLPVTWSVPWGWNVGLTGTVLPYLPLPAKLRTAVLPPMRPEPGESAAVFGDRVQAAMQSALGAMTTRGRG